MKWKSVRRLVHEASENWLPDPNVVMVDYGYALHGGVMATSAQPCLRVHVVRKLAEGPQLEAAVEHGWTTGRIPSTFGGVPVDVLQGDYRPKWTNTLSPGRGSAASVAGRPQRQRHRPVLGGISISDDRVAAGTIGAVVRERSTGALMVLSNWHVLLAAHLAPGGLVRQPGTMDGGGGEDTIGRVRRHGMRAGVDAAVASLLDTAGTSAQLGLRSPIGVSTAQLGDVVVRVGRTSGPARGIVTGVEGQHAIAYGPRGSAVVRHVVTVTPARSGDELSLPGDSGSLWLAEERHEAVGLHFAGNAPADAEVALFMDLAPVLDALDVDLVV